MSMIDDHTIKTRPNSKEYIKNYDAIDWGRNKPKFTGTLGPVIGIDLAAKNGDETVIVTFPEPTEENWIFLKVGDTWMDGDCYGLGGQQFMIGTSQTGVKEGDIINDGMIGYRPRRWKHPWKGLPKK